MSSLLAAIAIPGVKSAVQAVHGVAASAGQSFADALRTAADYCHAEPTAGEIDDDGSAEDREALADRIATRLQELFDHAGAATGEEFHFAASDDGELKISGESAALATVQAMLASNQILAGDLWTLVTHESSESTPGVTFVAAS